MVRRKNGLYRFPITRDNIDKVMPIPGGFRQDIKDWLNEFVGPKILIDKDGSKLELQNPIDKGWGLFSTPGKGGMTHFVVFTHVSDMVHFRLVWI